MHIINIEERFKDNAHKVRKKVIWHWTGSSTAKSAIDWLDQRNNGEGTVAYCYIIEGKDVYMLGNPNNTWFHNTGLGSEYDKDTIPIAIVSRGKKDKFPQDSIDSAKKLYSILKGLFEIYDNTHHASINKNKQDFPEHIWKEFKSKIT